MNRFCPSSLSECRQLIASAARAWLNDDGPRLGAALSFYTTFSLAPILVVIITVVAVVFGRDAAQGHIVEQISGLVGAQAADTIESMINHTYLARGGGWASALAAIALLIGASAVFAELQSAFNYIWKVESPPAASATAWLRARILSFSMVVVVGFLLLASLVVSAVINATEQWVTARWGLNARLVLWFNATVSLGVVGVVFGLLFKVLPDAHVRWGDVWFAALVAALMFNVGQFFIGLYIGKTGVATAYGAAGSLAVILIWVYYSAQIVLFGAELARSCAEFRWRRAM